MISQKMNERTLIGNMGHNVSFECHLLLPLSGLRMIDL